MARHNELGKEGELIARKFLENLGYRIEATNWRFGRAEVDLIAWDGQVLVFVEVKTRQNNTFGYPESAVSAKKESLLLEASGEYIYQIGYDGEIRFDIISIILLPVQEIQHFKDAFFPGWDV